MDLSRTPMTPDGNRLVAELPAATEKHIVLIACMTGRRRGGRRECTRACEDEAIRCILYHDSEVGNQGSQIEHVGLGSYTTLVPPLPTPPGPLQCCDAAWRGRPALANGSNSFFCRPHVKLTLSSQYRFLPALAHASRVLASSATMLWLVLVDDDSRVDAAWLLSLLRSPALAPHAQREGLYLGDFGPATYRGSTTREVPGTAFACGGGGHVFDRAAVRKLDFVACARRYHGNCMQSDWMIGKCAQHGGVEPMGPNGSLAWTSCGLCAASCSRRSKERLLETFRRPLLGCAFAQQTPATLCEHDAAFRQTSCQWSASSCSGDRCSALAIRHNWCECSEPGCTFQSQRAHVLFGGTAGTRARSIPMRSR